VERQSASAYFPWDITWTLCNACNPTFSDRSGVPHAHVECAPCMGLDRKITLFKLIVKFFLKGVVFMFWHDIVYVELLYCVINFELVWTWNKVAVVENAKKYRPYPTFPYLNVSTSCSVFPLSCRIHYLGSLKKHNTSIVLVLIFVPA